MHQCCPETRETEIYRSRYTGDPRTRPASAPRAAAAGQEQSQHSSRAPSRTRGRRSFNQSRGKAKRLAKLRLFLGHSPIIALVIVSLEVKDAVKNQNLHLLRGRVSPTARVFGGDVSRNGNVPGR